MSTRSWVRLNGMLGLAAAACAAPAREELDEVVPNMLREFPPGSRH